MSKMSVSISFTVLVSILCLPVFSEPENSSPGTAKVTDGSAEKLADLQQCDAKIMSFSIRPPKDYILETEKGPDGIVQFFWHGKPRTDGSAGVFTITTVPKTQTGETLSADGFLSSFFKTGAERADAMDHSEPKDINVKGRKFKFATFRRIKNGNQYNGFVVVTESQKAILSIASQDVAGQDASVDAGWASVQSFNSDAP